MMQFSWRTPKQNLDRAAETAKGSLRQPALRTGLAALIMIPLLTACPTTTEAPKIPEAPKVTSLTATPDEITTFNEPFTITWTTSGTTATHVCRLSIRTARAGDDTAQPIDNAACTDTMQHTPEGEGDFEYLLTIHQGTSGTPITQATSNTVTRRIPHLGDTIWTRQFGTNALDQATSVATDAAGNIIITGYTEGSLQGDNAGGTDAFVRKYDPNGNELWTHQFGTDADDEAWGVTTDAAGNIIITGNTLGSLQGNNAGSYDVFVRKYDPNGTELWTLQSGTNTWDQARGIATDAAGNIIITGDTYGSLQGDNAGGRDAFVRKYDPNGLALWTHQFGIDIDDEAWGVTTDAAGNIIITGYTYGALQDDNAGSSDAFVRKYDPTGNILWTQQFGTSGWDGARGIATDAAGNLIITGDTVGSLQGDNAGDGDAFVRKYEPNGNELWTHQVGSNAYDRGTGVATDAAGNIIITGITDGALQGNNAGSRDAFARKFDPNGNVLWTQQFGTNALDFASSIVTDAAGNIIITGFTRGSLQGNNAGSSDVFIRKFTP